MGKTGTTNGFRDALFVGSTFGPTGITVAVRIGYDDNRSLGNGETGGRVAVPVFRRLVEGVYRDGSVAPAAPFPTPLEQGIDGYLEASAARDAAAEPTLSASGEVPDTAVPPSYAAAGALAVTGATGQR
jgi:penicillin-binding protein 1A